MSKTWRHSKKKDAEVIYLGRLRIYILPKDMLEERLKIHFKQHRAVSGGSCP